MVQCGPNTLIEDGKSKYHKQQRSVRIVYNEMDFGQSLSTTSKQRETQKLHSIPTTTHPKIRAKTRTRTETPQTRRESSSLPDDDGDLSSPFVHNMVSDEQLVPVPKGATVPAITADAKMRNREPTEEWENM